MRTSNVFLFALAAGCASNGPSPATPVGGDAATDRTTPPTAPSCTAAGGSAVVQAPVLRTTLVDRYQEGWLGSPAVADLDGDGKAEIVIPREGLVVAWRADGSLAWRYDTGNGRIWASPVVGDFLGDTRLEVAVAARDKVYLLDAAGKVLPGFPITWLNEIRGLAAADVDGDGQLDIVASVGRSSPVDVVAAWHADGTKVTGFPPNESGTSGCAADGKCYFAGCYDQNVAAADLDGDGKADVVTPHDNAYASFWQGTGVAFDANPIFPVKKTPGVRYLLDLAEAKQGYSDHEETSLQAHFTNTAPSLADLDGDGKLDIILLSSVQNTSQTRRELGVALWAVRPDGSRLASWQVPAAFPDYLAGLWDYEGTNVVAATNQVAVADIDPGHAGPELIFAGFDGRIHAVGADGKALWASTYTTDAQVLTGGVVVGDLSADGVPEIVLATYSPDEGKGKLLVLDSGGTVLHQVVLPKRGAMPVPTLADVDGDGTVEIVVSLKDGEDKLRSALIFTVPGSKTNCLAWPTARGNLLRNGTLPVKK